ncbi:MAG: hypothetical protein UY07_C0015G0009 [Parcubacteria group bacterium GW2011_GWA1_47_8]|nr:MAG: hypothetical protein UY07_C0015G0009 [Parcubacteria group bacterium GW2011_GWA1_47_8]
MTKYTAIILLGVFVAALAFFGGPPSAVRTVLYVASGLGIAVLSYLSSVVYCSNCKKLIEDAEQAFDTKASGLSENAPQTKAPPQDITSPPMK